MFGRSFQPINICDPIDPLNTNAEGIYTGVEYAGDNGW
jgi:hypothetical protein